MGEDAAIAARDGPIGVQLERRPEAILVCDTQADEIDDRLVAAIESLAASGVYVALAGLEDAGSIADAMRECRSGRIVVADHLHALVVNADQADAPGWRFDSGRSFTQWFLQLLWERGVGPMLLAVVAHRESALPPPNTATMRRLLPAGSVDALDAFLEVVAAERTAGELPGADESPGWTVVIEPWTEDSTGVHASLLALSSGTVGVPGDLEDRADSERFVMVSGAYGLANDGLVRFLPGPAWTNLHAEDGEVNSCRRVLDLRTGVLVREPVGEGLRTVRFVSLSRPGIGALRGEDSSYRTSWPPALAPPATSRGLAAASTWVSETNGEREWAETVGDRGAVISVARQRTWQRPQWSRVERVVAIRGDGRTRDEPQTLLDNATADGFDHLLDEQRRVWSSRWECADVEIVGDPEAQRAIRFALFHLLSCAPTVGEAAVGARGLTGLAYAGHVFWDTDVFVLPALAATQPESARAVLQYRINRLDAARRNAAERELPGARFPWESADTGEDVTPTSTRDVEGRIVPIRTGEHAEHINADVAWAAQHYLHWTGDPEFLCDGGRDLVLDSARYWLARLRKDATGRAHLYGVIGPDEYHAPVDDNAYTNNMARWHMEWAAELTHEHGHAREASRLRAAADALVDGYDAASQRHEQFAGYWDLEPLLIGEIAEPPVAADILLGRERVSRSQVIKQPDVLMLHHLLPDSRPPGSLPADLDFYLPRTAHGSSLSPAICASLLARSGRPDDALTLFDVAARLDLDDLTGTTAGGLHLATMGGLWQAVVYGFGGIRPNRGGLRIDPHLPRRWERLSVRVRHRGVPIQVCIDRDMIEVTSAAPISVTIAGRTRDAPFSTRFSAGGEAS